MVKKSARCTRRTHSPAFKAQVALDAMRDDETMAELCKEYEVHASQILDCKRQLLEGLPTSSVPTAESCHRWTWRRCTPRSASWRWRTMF